MPRSLTLLLLAFCLLLAPGLATASTWSPHFLPAWALDLGRTDPGDVAGLAALGCPTRAVLPIILASATSADADLVESYAYDANGNVEFVTTGASSVDAYTYDELDRLTDADFFDGSSIGYTWDDAGNLQAREGSSPSLDALDFDLSAYTWSYNHVPGWAYDGAGQVLETTSDAEVLTWHPTGKPSALQGDDYVEVAYDHAGRRSVVRWCETDSTCTGDETYDLYLYDPDGRVLARLQSPAADTRPLLQELYIYAGGQLLGFLDFSSGWSNGRPFWVHTDLQGSLRLVTDASGEAMQELRWSPMGTLLYTSAPMLQDALGFAWQPLPYRGVPVVDVGARVRHAEYGWFLSPDPVAWGEPSDPQTFHRSQYARGNPMTYVDPWGENPVAVWALAEGALTLADVGATAHTAYGVVAGTETVGALALEVGGTAAGALLPGGGYGAGIKGGREAAELAVKQGLLVRLRGFTQRNFRENLGRLTGGARPGVDAHHVLPQALADKFERLGINVHDPRLAAWWPRGDHGSKAWEYNLKWDDFFERVSNPSKDDVLNEARRLSEEYGFDVLF